MKMKKASTAHKPLPAKRKASALQIGEMQTKSPGAANYRARTCIRVYCLL
ncbi:hypothetical protein AZ78_3486 [Lysobacter capsici AZ78]|uniref:Uncharacterized protein n=1 Tax=Lysobacter capsici AZ78 TaxID=1444315 RepID=A0A120AHC5_9GAMM|nr:hypothetical protein [Lysobacter capsici]KWS05932.1 hypothetical protein AZ78_3486 [Lysobacter capsici AZ78]